MNTNNKLCLGTAQFGLHYGINNSGGKPSRQDVFSMLNKALAQGIRWFDTAAAYGDAEELLGEYGIGRHDVKIVSKQPPGLQYETGTEQTVVEESIAASLRRLRLEQLEGYLLHDPQDFYNHRIQEALFHCKEKGLIANIGVSIYEEQQALDAVASGLVDYIQVPYNVLDQRLEKTNFFSVAQERRVTVFGRSAFLQGLLLMNRDTLPVGVAGAGKFLEEFDAIIKEFNFSRLEAAFLFSYMNPGLNKVVFGVDNVNQLNKYGGIIEKQGQFAACRQALVGCFDGIDKKIIMPNLWNK